MTRNTNANSELPQGKRAFRPDFLQKVTRVAVNGVEPRAGQAKRRIEVGGLPPELQMAGYFIIPLRQAK